MITFKPIIEASRRRRDGTYPVRIRVTFKGVVRRLPTTLVCVDADLTRSGRIKNATILDKAGELITRMRSACEDLSPFVLADWTVDQVVAHIQERLRGESFRLDFFTFADEYILCKRDSTRRSYTLALNALERFLGRRDLDVNEITKSLLLDFQEYIDKEPKMQRNKGKLVKTEKHKKTKGVSGFYTGKLAHIYTAAKWKFNDEDAGRIVIPRSPFDGLKKAYPQSKSPEPLEVKVVQMMIDAHPETREQERAIAFFLISFATMGANLADLYSAPAITGDSWKYYRQKTTHRRADKAESRVYLPACLRALVTKANHYCEPNGYWLPDLHRWANKDSATSAINRGLRKWAEKEGLEPFTFGAARHTWGTIARSIGVEKATVDEALVHVGDFRVTDIYAQRNWRLAWEANDKVLALFRWPDL